MTYPVLDWLLNSSAERRRPALTGVDEAAVAAKPTQSAFASRLYTEAAHRQ